jgi:Protein of unknown function (DUF3093)
MRVYHERLRVPLSWWLLGLAAVAFLVAELVPLIGFTPLGSPFTMISLVGSALFVLGVPAMLFSWGRARIEVTAGHLRAGRARLPLAAAGDVAALDESQTRAMRGRQADPAAYVLTRPFLRRAVWVEVSDPAIGTPYWLVGTRDPAALAGAIRSARPAARADGGAMG